MGRLLVAKGGHFVGAAGQELSTGAVKRGQGGPRGDPALAFPLDALLYPIPRGTDLVRRTPCVLTNESLGEVAVAFLGAVAGDDGLARLERKSSEVNPHGQRLQIWGGISHLQAGKKSQREEEKPRGGFGGICETQWTNCPFPPGSSTAKCTF